MKVIDLLNKIANGEELPDKIFYDGNDYKLVEYGETTKLYQCLSEPYELFNINTDRLNEEVEIIEEDKKIKKIDLSEWAEITYSEDWEMLTKDFNRNSNLFVKKINEIIDYLEEKE